jgi:hypothetical protein
MPHIELPEGFPGLRGPLVFSPATTKPLRELAEVLLHASNSLSHGEREMIACGSPEPFGDEIFPV